jgi:hypothetical protein
MRHETRDSTRDVTPDVRRIARAAVRAAACTATFTLVAVGCSGTSLKATPPRVVAGALEAPRLAALPPSVVDAPIAYELAPALKALEEAVPRNFGDINEKITNPSNTRQQFAFKATRTPFRVKLAEQQLTLSTVVEYQGRGWYSPPIGPTVSAGCGVTETRPRVRVSIVSTLDLTSDWKLKTRTRVSDIAPYTATPRDQCRVTMFNIDVTGKVVGAVQDQLKQRLPQVDRQLARFDIRTQLESWYNLLNKGIKIADSLWLSVNPGSVGFGGLRATDSTLIADVRLYAQPAIISGAQPPASFTPLPALESARKLVGDSAHMLVEGTLDYDVASALLEKALVGREFRRFGRRVSIAKARLYGLGDGRVALALKFAGTVVGEGYLVGTPRFDVASSMLYVPDLNFDVATSDALMQGVAWLRKDDVLSQLRSLARFSLADVIEKGRDKVERSINRELAQGVRLTAQLRSGRVIDVVALTRAIMVRGEAVGTLGLSVDREIPTTRKVPEKSER